MDGRKMMVNAIKKVVQAIKKSSFIKKVVKAIKTSSCAGVVVPGVPLLRSSEKKKKRRSAEDEEDIEGTHELIPRKKRVENKMLPENSNTLFTKDIACPEGRKIGQSDFEKFFRRVGKVVNVWIQFCPNERFVKFAEIEFESHKVAKNALKKYDMRRLFGSVVKLDVSREAIEGTPLCPLQKRKKTLEIKENIFTQPSSAPLLVWYDGKRKKYSSDAEVVAGLPLSRSSAEEKDIRGDTQLSPDNKEQDMEMVADHAPLYLHEFVWVDKILPRDSKTLFATNISCAGREIGPADFEKFFRKVGKVVNVCITLTPNQLAVELAEIEFESHDVAKKALEELNLCSLFGCGVELDVCPEGSGKSYENLDSTYRRQIICICLGKANPRSLELALRNHFSSCGEIKWVRAKEENSIWHAYMEFMEGSSFSKALKLDGTEFGGAHLQVRRAKVFCTSILY